jgi:hypothetical protein
MRRFALTAATIVFLVGCGTSTTTAVTCDQQYWNGVFGVCLPKGWGLLDRELLQSRGISDQVVAAFQAEKVVSGQNPTVTVTTERLKSPMTSGEYSKASIRSVTTLPGYTLLDSATASVEGQSVEIHTFTAQPVTGEPERRFTQVSAVAANIGYTFTALTPVSISDTLSQEVLLILKSVRFTEPTKE